MKRLLGTVRYWVRRAVRPTSLCWTDHDDYYYEWAVWEHEEEEDA